MDAGVRSFRRSPWLVCVFTLLLLTAPKPLQGATESELREAEQVYRNGSLDQARTRYLGLLGSGSDEVVVLRLLEIAVRLGQWSEAQRWDTHPGLGSSAESLFWRAQSLIGRGVPAQGLAALERLTRESVHPLTFPARLTLATHAVQEENYARAQTLLEGLSWDAHEPEVDYLRARIAAATGDRLDAINRLERLRQSPRTLPSDWQERLHFDLARLRFDEGQDESGEVVIRAYLEQFPGSSHGRAALEWLRRRGGLTTADQRERWENWSRDQPEGLRDVARIELAKAEAAVALEGDTSLLNSALARIDPLEEPHALASEAAILRGRWYLRAGNIGGSLALLTPEAIDGIPDAAVRRELTFLRGLALFEARRTAEAYDVFARLERSSISPDRIIPAAYNAAVTAGIAETAAFGDAIEDTDPLDSHLRRLENLADPSAQENLSGDAVFHRALLLARGNDARGISLAGRLLKRFVERYPDHPRLSQALLARAELALGALPPEIPLARQCLEELRRRRHEETVESNPEGEMLESTVWTPEDRERLDYLEIWEASLAGDAERVRELGDGFASRYPQSPLLDNARLRIAEVDAARLLPYMGEAALDRLTLSPSASEAARLQLSLITAQALQRLGHHDRAVKEWSTIMGVTEGETQRIARHQQALVLTQRGRLKESLAQWDPSLAQWDEILRGQPSPELRVRVLTAKGEYLTLLGQWQPALYPEALAVFDQVLSFSGAPAQWFEQALYRKGVVHGFQKNQSEAYSAFSQVVDRFESRSADWSEEETRSDPALKWYFRSGFEAMVVLERREQWEAAARMADRLALRPGVRGAQAKERGAKIRVAHWLW